MKRFNFKWCVYVLLCVVIMPFFCVILTPSTKVFAASDFTILQNEYEISSVRGDFSGMKVNSVDDAFAALNNFREEFGFNTSKEALKFIRKIQSVTGVVYRFDQYVDNTKVYGGEVILNVNSEGRITSINCSYYKNVQLKDISYTIEDAVVKIEEAYNTTQITYLENNIIPEENNCLAYVFETHMLDDIYRIYVCSGSLEIVKIVKATTSLTDTMLDELPSLSDYTKEDVTTTYIYDNGETTTLNIDKYVSKTKNEYFYILGDSERAIYITDGKNQTDEKKAEYYATYSESAAFNTEIAVKAYEYIMDCYDFYLDSSNFGVSIEGLTNPNGKNILLLAIVHYDKNYENAAFYLPSDSSTTGYFYFGDGNISKGTGSFVNGLDVVGHEYQHCITDSVVSLEYFNESGAICEAYSDIFGACIEGNELSDANFWRMGEDIYMSQNQYFRDMSKPSLTGCTLSYENLYPLCTSKTCSHTNCDNGGVHYNSTLMTYATYIMYQQDPDFFTKSNILKLWYQTLTKLSEKTTFIEFAELMLQSAEELNFPEDNILDIEFAFASINLPGYSGIKIWGGNTLQYLQGSGTIAYPYLINSAADLASVAYYINTLQDETYASSRYQVNVDLNLQNIPWEGIGTKDNPFNGVFNGGGKTITGLNISAKMGDIYSGLFCYTGEDSYIYDVRVGSGSVNSNAKYTGAITGLLQGTISGCSSELNIIGDKVGGIAGLVVNSLGGEKVVNSFVTGNLKGDVVGGLIAEFSTPLNKIANLHLSGYVTSSYTTGHLIGDVVGGIIGRANGICLANIITTATLEYVSKNSVLGGLVGELYFKDINNSKDATPDVVSNMILSAKSAGTFNMQNQNVLAGLLIGVFKGEISEGTLYIENTFAKKYNEIGYCSSQLDGLNVKLQDTSIVTDNVFEGVFDFDNKKYYQDSGNWTVLNGIEAFDLVSTFEVKSSNQMPKFIDSDFWLNHAASGFDSGTGTEQSPFIIKTAEQLALMASLIGSEYYNNYYSNKYYKLGANIDLSGKIWVGVGATHINVVNGSSSATIYPFTGVFDGAGYLILNMTAIAAYSVTAINSTGTNYKLIEYSPALFGVTNIYSSKEFVSPTIKNLCIEDINNRGSYAASVVSKVYMSINLENVSVSNGNITSDFVAGGLIGGIDGLGYSNYGEITSNIVNCDTQVNVSGRIIGGAVGYVTNASSMGSTLNIINYLNKGKISATGEELDSEIDNDSSYYYRPIAGSVIGVTLVKNLYIINSINLGEVVSYNYGCFIGGFIGSIGIGGSYTSNIINITIDGSKQIGNVYYIFDNVISSAGSIIGGTHQELASLITLKITDTTYTNQKDSIIANDNSIGLTLDSKLIFSEDEVGFGDYDIYNKEYFRNSKYFNSDYYWDEAQITKLLVTITFRDNNGNELGVINLAHGQTSIDINDTPIPENITTGQYEYVFAGWDRDLTNITKSGSVYAEYVTKVREYLVTYLDNNGEIIETRKLAFGTSVNQDVEAPNKKSGLLFDYEFVRWGEEGQTVTGQMILTPVYKTTLNLSGKIILVAIFVALVIIIYSSYKKRREYNN